MFCYVSWVVWPVCLFDWLYRCSVLFVVLFDRCVCLIDCTEVLFFDRCVCLIDCTDVLFYLLSCLTVPMFCYVSWVVWPVCLSNWLYRASVTLVEWFDRCVCLFIVVGKRRGQRRRPCPHTDQTTWRSSTYWFPRSSRAGSAGNLAPINPHRPCGL